MSVVPGEDSESEEELAYETPSEDEHGDSNTKHVPSASAVKGTIVSGEDPETDDEVAPSPTTAAQPSARTVVSGEESETDEEEDRTEVPAPKVSVAKAHASKARKMMRSEKKEVQTDVKRESSSKT